MNDDVTLRMLRPTPGQVHLFHTNMKNKNTQKKFMKEDRQLRVSYYVAASDKYTCSTNMWERKMMFAFLSMHTRTRKAIQKHL